MRFGIIGGGFGYDCHFEALKNIKGVEIVGIADFGARKLLTILSNPFLSNYIYNFYYQILNYISTL